MSATHAAWGLLVLAALLSGCDQTAGGWTPVLESTPPAYLERELEQTLAEVRRAGVVVETEPESAAAELDRAAGRLVHLTEVYLPLYRAKVVVTNAYREQALGDTGEALRSVAAARDAVAAVNRATEGALESELQQVVEPLADARLALESGSDAGAHLQRAAEKLEDLLARAGLLT